MKKFVFIALIVSCSISASLKGQNEGAEYLYSRFETCFKKLDFKGAEDYLLRILDLKDTLNPKFLNSVHIGLGIIYYYTGRYDEALDNYTKAEKLTIGHTKDVNSMAIIFNNKANIYDYQKSYAQAIEYYEKSIRSYLTLPDTTDGKYLNLSRLYMNLGISLLGSGDYKAALNYLNKSAELKIKFNFEGLEIVERNLGNAYTKVNDPVKAEFYFKKSISTCIKNFGVDYFRLAEIYSDYSVFLGSINRNDESLKALKNALEVYLRKFSRKHPQVSRIYNLIGDHYSKVSAYDSAMVYYQKALISVISEFNDTDIFSKPPINSSLLDIQLLAILKSKAQCFELLSVSHNDPGKRLAYLKNSMENIELAITLIDRIRNNFPTEESKMYLAENEKETYIFATHIAYSLFTFRPDLYTTGYVYRIAKKSKAAILRNEISGNELLWSADVPDSLRKKQNNLAGNIAANNFMMNSEMRKPDADQGRLDFLKDELFDMNRENEILKEKINKAIPQLRNVLQMTEPDSLAFIRNNLESDETIIDYLISNTFHNGKRTLYTFVITRDLVQCSESLVDSSFATKANIIRVGDKPGSGDKKHLLYQRYTNALNYMYETLIRPSQDLFAGKRLIIIPDEEIAWLPFEAFLKDKPGERQSDYEGLHFLVHDYEFSYGYSSSLISGKSGNTVNNHKVYSFLPEYNTGGIGANGVRALNGAENEINSIYKWFSGIKFKGDEATEENFRKSADKSVIFHLAMHALPDSTNSRYSFFLFNKGTDTVNDGKLYNYEISLSRLNSPMIVLSACNSGTGKLFQGEGMMSLARGFMLAGASSVIKTAWEVNDEISARIISDFYRYLSQGKPKDMSMRLSKLNYLKNSRPYLQNPYFWAAYEVMGDNSPVKRSNKSIVILLPVAVVLLLVLFLYRRLRKIFSDRLL